MINLLIGVLGLIMVFAGTREVVLTFRRSTFRVRGGRLLRRRSHSVIFWINVAGISVFSAVGVMLIIWALSG